MSCPQDALEAFESMLSCLQEENSEVIDEMRENKISGNVGLSHSLVPKRMLLNPESLSSSSVPLSNPFEGWMCRFGHMLICRSICLEDRLMYFLCVDCV